MQFKVTAQRKRSSHLAEKFARIAAGKRLGGQRVSFGLFPEDLYSTVLGLMIFVLNFDFLTVFSLHVLSCGACTGVSASTSARIKPGP